MNGEGFTPSLPVTQKKKPKMQISTLRLGAPNNRKLDEFYQKWSGFYPLRLALASWALLGRSWNALRTVLGRLETLLGRFWAVLGRSWDVLGRSWDPLGRILGRLGGILGKIVLLTKETTSTSST